MRIEGEAITSDEFEVLLSAQLVEKKSKQKPKKKQRKKGAAEEREEEEELIEDEAQHDGGKIFLKSVRK